MDRKKPESIGEVLRGLFEENSMQSRLDELKATEIWALVVGEHLASLCGRPYVNSGIMTIGVKAPPLRQELNMNRGRLCEAVNKTLGKNIIKEIRFVS